MRAALALIVAAACGGHRAQVTSGGTAAPSGPGWFCRVDVSDDGGSPSALCHRDACPDPVKGYHASSECAHQDVAYCTTTSDEGQAAETSCAPSAQACSDIANETDEATMGEFTASPCTAQR